MYADLNALELVAAGAIIAACTVGLAILTRPRKPPPIPQRTRRSIDQVVRHAELPWCPRSLEAQRRGYGYAHKLDAPDEHPDACINCGPAIRWDHNAFVTYNPEEP